MGDKKKKSGLKKFFKDNRSLAITLPILLVLVIAVVLVYVLNGRDRTSETQPNSQPTQTSTVQTENPTPEPSEETSDSSGTEVTTLPQDERDKDQSEILHNPFADPYMVSGIVYDKSGGSVAIVEAENKTYIVEAGDVVDGYFEVVSIESDQVVLEIDGQEVVLTLSGQ